LTRNSLRFPLKLQMAVMTATEAHSGETSNISGAGVLFNVKTDLSVGSTIKFAIRMPAEKLGTVGDVLLNCVGRVMRCSRKGSQRTVAAVIDDYQLESCKTFSLQ
jgi:hypothetical protein